MADREEIKNRRWGAIVSLGVHLALLLLFFFILAWKEPYPPLPEYGIELNFGLDPAGSGDVQPTAPAVQSDEQQEAQPEVDPSEQESDQEMQPEDEIQPDNAESLVEDVETTESESALVPQEASPIESPDVTPIQQSERARPTTKPAESEQVPAAQEAVPATTSQPVEPGEQASSSQNNQGDRAEEVGDQGDPKGSLDARALYGKPGGGDGAALELTGWVWDFVPRPNDPSQESGRIVFEIIIDDQGDLISVRTLERTVSPNIEKIYKAEVEKLTFSPTTRNTLPAPRSTGTITFIIRSR